MSDEREPPTPELNIDEKFAERMHYQTRIAELERDLAAAQASLAERKREVESAVCQMNEAKTERANMEVDLAAAHSRNEQWMTVVRDIGHAVNCLYSVFPDANGHIVSTIQTLKADLAALEADLTQAVQMYTDAAGERDKALADLAAAQSCATTLAVSMHKQHYAEAAPNWQPLPDLAGLLTQIDNMYAGLRNDLEALKVENKRLVGLPLATLIAERDALRAAWETAKRQNSHDMLLSGDEIHQHNEAIWIAGCRK